MSLQPAHPPDRLRPGSPVYAALTISLSAVYFGGVALLQALIVRLTGQESTLAFTQRAQLEAELDQISADILGTVREALEPEGAAVNAKCKMQNLNFAFCILHFAFNLSAG